MHLIDNWINDGSGWIVESIEPQYINISTYRLLSGSSYVKLPVDSRSPRKGLINIKNKDRKCFLWCHVRYIGPVKIHPERIKKEDKNFLIILIMMKLNFLCKKKILARLKRKIIFAVTCLVTKMGWFFQFLLQIKNLKTLYICCMQLMAINHTMCTSKILTDLWFTKQKIKTKNTIVRVAYSVLVVKMCWQNIKTFVEALMLHKL